MIKTGVYNAIKEVVGGKDFALLNPRNPDYGDYAVHMSAVGSQVSEVSNFKNDLFSKIKEVGDFINFTINPEILAKEAVKILEEKETYGSGNALQGKKIVVEFAHPNTHKIFHIGHLRNITTGESLSRILETSSAHVIRVNYQGDIGLHIAKCLYIVQKRQVEMTNLKSLDEKIAFLGKAYTEGTLAYEEDDNATKRIQELNRQIFHNDPSILPLLQETRKWSLEYFERIYKRVGTKFDRLFFESEVADSGMNIVKDLLAKGVLSESEGAIIFDGKKYGVDTRVFINSLGLPTYEAKELGVAKLEFSEFGEIDKCIHVVTPEQSSFFKVTFKVQELLDPKKYKDKQMHFIYEFVDLKGGKMSSREGNVVSGEWLLDEVRNRIMSTYSTEKDLAEIISVASVKYAFLKVDAKKKIKFDIDESISLHGNSAPYLLYTYARCQSILKKVDSSVIASKAKQSHTMKIATSPSAPRNDYMHEELSLLRTFFKFPEVVEDSAKNYAPHLIATYIFDLAQKFNLFYEKLPILKAEEEDKQKRLLLVQSTAQVIKNGLYLLGIETLDSI